MRRSEESRTGFGVIQRKVKGRGGVIQNLLSILAYTWTKSLLVISFRCAQTTTIKDCKEYRKIFRPNIQKKGIERDF